MGLFGSDNSDAASDAIARNRQIYGNIPLPEYEDWAPELYDTDSAQYQLTSDDPVTRSMQMSALNKMAGLADEGLSDADQAEFTKASNDANQLARSGNQAALQNAQARGVGGSGLEFLMREQANQDAAQRAQDAGLQTAATAAKQRALYNQAFLQGTSNMRDQDYKTNANNASIINQFNMANTQARNQVNQANTGLKNQAFQYNQDLKDKNYQNQLGQADRIAGLNNQSAALALEDEKKKRGQAQAVGSAVGGGIGAAVGGPVGYSVGSSVGGAAASY